jgi:adenylosuccinate lyase
VERVILPDSTILCHYMLHRTTGILDGLLVYPERMRENLLRMKGLVYSQTVLSALTRSGMTREDAYAAVQRHAMRVWAGEGSFQDLLAQDSEIGRALSAPELAACFDPARTLQHVDAIYDRLFGTAGSGARSPGTPARRDDEA